MKFSSLRKELKQWKEWQKYFTIYFERREDTKFRDYISAYSSKHINLKIRHMGNKNKGHIIYIANCGRETGFFAQHRTMLKALLFAEQLGMIPVVEYTEKFAYASLAKGKNPFEYYFQSVSDIDLKDAYQSCNVVFFEQGHEDKFSDKGNDYLISEKEMALLAHAQKKYIHLRPEIKASIDNGIQTILKNKLTLGVHVRGTDFNNGYDGHPKAVKGEQYFKFIDEAIEQYKFEQIFLATDDKRILELFIKRYDNFLAYYEHVRNENNTSVAYTENGIKNGFQLGYEVLADMMTLASCQGLVAGLSQVSIMARVQKLSVNEKYIYTHIINRGINYKANNISLNAKERRKFR